MGDCQYSEMFQEMVNAIMADQSNAKGVKALHGYVLLNTLNFIGENYAEMRTPYLLLHGEKDKICSVEGSKVCFLIKIS